MWLERVVMYFPVPYMCNQKRVSPLYRLLGHLINVQTVINSIALGPGAKLVGIVQFENVHKPAMNCYLYMCVGRKSFNKYAPNTPNTNA